uniref:Ig-like domain-containing protein n=1 Tax=Echeneis naucrates TaxID=173247 RepID=A0A665TNA8_ECHNA
MHPSFPGAKSSCTVLFCFTGHTVKRVMWFRVSVEGRREFTHHTDPNQISLSYRGRTRNGNKVCSVQIRAVKLSDAGQYHFRFETDQPLGRWTSPDTVTLDVTGRYLQVQVHPARPANMFGFGETVFVGCQARGCAASGRSLVFKLCFCSLSPLPDGPRSTSIAVFPVGEVSEGGSVTLTCSSDAAPPVESFAWFKGTGQSSCVFLGEFSTHHAGQYYCTVSNRLGYQTSPVATLTHGAPSPAQFSPSQRSAPERAVSTTVRPGIGSGPTAPPSSPCVSEVYTNPRKDI